MAYGTKQILTDVDGKPIPQIWDEAADAFVPSEGNVKLTGSNVEQTNGEDIALKSNLFAGESPTGKQVPVAVDEDGKVQVGGITVESLTATEVGILAGSNEIGKVQISAINAPRVVAGVDIGYYAIAAGETYVLDEFKLANVQFKEVYYVLGFTTANRAFTLEWIGVRNESWDIANNLWVQYFKEVGDVGSDFVFDDAIIIDPRSTNKNGLMTLITTLKLSPGGTDNRLVITNNAASPLALRRGFRMEVY